MEQLIRDSVSGLFDLVLIYKYDRLARDTDDQRYIEKTLKSNGVKVVSIIVIFPTFEPKVRKSGTGCVTMINDHLFEGRYSPRNAYGKRETHNIYAKTREECEEKLATMIAQVKADIKAEKERLKTVNESFSLEFQ